MDLKEAVTLEELDKIAVRDFPTNMKDKNASVRMQDLLARYHTSLSRNDLRRIIKDNKNVAVWFSFFRQ